MKKIHKILVLVFYATFSLCLLTLLFTLYLAFTYMEGRVWWIILGYSASFMAGPFKRYV